MDIARSIGWFVAAGLCEIGGGYLIWLWLRAGWHWSAGIAGALILALYGVIPTFQDAPFGRVYAAYGGIFVILALLWATVIDRNPPDRYDLIGAAVVATGFAIIMFAPRG